MPEPFGLSTNIWITFIVVLFALIVFLLLAHSKKQINTRNLSAGALCIALGFILSVFLKLPFWPYGGSITPGSMMPVMIFSWLYGPLAGLAASVVYGALQLLDNSFIVHPVQLILDYILAFASMAFAGCFFRSQASTSTNSTMKPDWLRRLGFPIGVSIACLSRFFCHLLSGVFFFEEYAIEAGLSPWIYSWQYNGTYMLFEWMICLSIACVLSYSGILKTLKRIGQV